MTCSVIKQQDTRKCDEHFRELTESNETSELHVWLQLRYISLYKALTESENIQRFSK